MSDHAENRVRVYLAVSLDGYIAGPDDDLDWLHDPELTGAPAEEDAAAAGAITFEGFMADIGAMLMGRRTYDVVEGFGQWPYGDTPVHVATTRALEPPFDPEVSRHITAVSGTIEALITSAKERAFPRDVYLDGGALVQQALNAGLVDELTLTFVPVLLGGGVRLFDNLVARRRLRFTGHHRYGTMSQLVAEVSG